MGLRVGLLTSGGDCPGLNAAIRSVVRKAEAVYGDEILGFSDGWKGVMKGEWRSLTIEVCRGLLPLGGTILGTSRLTPQLVPGGVDKVRSTIAGVDLDGFVVIGGNGSLGCAHALAADGIRCVGIPKTID